MKKIIYLFSTSLLLTFSAQAQQRNCGVTEYENYLNTLDKSRQERIEENEKQVQQWIAKHPIQAQGMPATDVYPVLPGFTPSGNQVQDEVNYIIAKRNYLASIGKLYGQNIPNDVEHDQELRAAKRASHQFKSQTTLKNRFR
ncbi:hypothetical protein BH11BAC2_BH11BAC2_17000 [soil metagenome]